jgi:hypothetical protein
LDFVYSFNKRGFEAEYWKREIEAASNSVHCFHPFNHGAFLEPAEYVRAQLLDNLYYRRHPGLLQMYAALRSLLEESRARVLVVDNCFPYHPEFLRGLPVFKVIRLTDGPMSAYDRDFAYLHAYDHVLYPRSAYSSDIDLPTKLRYCGARSMDFWPLGSFNAMCDPSRSEAVLLDQTRDVDVVFVGALHLDKMPMLASIKRKLGRRLRMHGLTTWKRNAYFNVKFGFPGWIAPISFDQYVPLYQRSRIGINVHLRGSGTLAGYRLFDLPANGVMQISDGGSHLNEFFKVGEEIESFEDASDCVEKVEYYLVHEDERRRMAENALRRVRAEYAFAHLLNKMATQVARLVNLRPTTSMIG